MDAVRLAKGEVLARPDEPIRDVFFLESGVGSINAVSPEGVEVEAGLFGRDGFAPTALLLGADSSPHRTIIQVKDDAWRIGKAPFLAAVEASASLRDLLMRYVQTLFVQTSFTALSNAVHPVDERLARWILMCADRIDGSELGLTHEFMAIMLAVRRSSVTTSLHVLEGKGLIRAERGCVIIRDRAALERFASESYGRPEASYRALIGPLR